MSSSSELHLVVGDDRQLAVDLTELLADIAEAKFLIHGVHLGWGLIGRGAWKRCG
jgi:hypothetical protein